MASEIACRRVQRDHPAVAGPCSITGLLGSFRGLAGNRACAGIWNTIASHASTLRVLYWAFFPCADFQLKHIWTLKGQRGYLRSDFGQSAEAPAGTQV